MTILILTLGCFDINLLRANQLKEVKMSSDSQQGHQNNSIKAPWFVNNTVPAEHWQHFGTTTV